MATKVHPIKPSEVGKTKTKIFPDETLETFNELIAQNFSERSARFTRDQAMSLMKEKGLKEDEIWENGWLNVEEVYRAQGWRVSFKSPDGDESFRAYYIFSY